MNTPRQTILVTGAAGLIGGEVCARAVAAGHRVLALVRNTPVVRGNDGVEVGVTRTLAGDVTQPDLGLGAQDIGAIDCVIHCAAALDFDAPRAVLDPVNVEGTRNVVSFANLRSARLIHVSTAYVCGTAEGTILEGPVPEATHFANNYEASKAAAERVVEDGAASWCIARPSIVLGEHGSGTIRDFPALCAIFRFMAQGAMPVLPASSAATLDLVPIDHVAQGLLSLAEAGDAACGRHFHLVSGSPLPARILADVVRAVDHFPDPVVVDPAQFDPAALSPTQRRVAARMLATFGGYMTRAPHFDDGGFRALTGIACPPTDAQWLRRLVEYGIGRGFLPQRTSG